jgi:DNA mismatch endonuclease, patch repair protein
MYNVQLIHSFHCFEFIELTLNKIFLQDRTVKQYEILEEEPMIAAEDVPATYKNKVT